MNWAAEFADFGNVAYMNCAYMGPFPRESAQAAQEAIGLKDRPDRIREGLFFETTSQVREELGKLLGAPADRFALTNGASDGVYSVARGIDWHPGDQVLTVTGDFPSNFYTWAQLACRGVELKTVAQDELLASLGPRTRVLSVSWVAYNSGYKIDLAKLGQACRDNGTLLIVDLSQGAGVLDLRLADLPVDAATCCGYKWLLSPYGTGFAYFTPEWTERLRVTDVYWESLEGAEDFNSLPREGWKFAPGARRFDSTETASFLNLYPMRASLRFLQRVGTRTIEDHCRTLLDCLVQCLPPGFRVAGSLEAAHRSTVMTIEGPDKAATRAAHQRALAAGVVVSLRHDRIRVAPHLFNTPEHIDRLITVLRNK